MDKIGIVSITYNSANVLQSFLDCLKIQEYKNFVLYVIDNFSNDNTLEILKAYNDFKIVIIENDKNQGVAKANNQGVNIALNDSCDYVLFLNNDIEFDANLVGDLLKNIKEEDCALAAPKIMFFDNPKNIWYAGSWFNKNKGYLPIHRGINETDIGQYNDKEYVEYAPTCCLLVNSKVFYDIGLMNEKYFVYFDDTDFLYRVFNDGRYKICYFPKIKLFHKVGSLTNSFINLNKKMFRGQFFLKQNIKNHIYYLRQIGAYFQL